MATSARRAPPAPESAYVLHHYDWSESSVILDLFSRVRGRVAVVAKGAKRPTSNLRAVLMPFQRLHVSLGSRRDAAEAEVLVLRGAEWAGGHTMPAGAGLLAGFYLNELLMKGLARGDPHALLFDAYAQTVPGLGAHDEGEVRAALRAFELVLLQEMGVLPELLTDTQTQRALAAERRYELKAESGLRTLPEGRAGGVPGAVWIGLQQSLDDHDLAGVQRTARAALPELKAQLRELLHYHLGTAHLRTRQVMVEVQQALD